MLDSWPVPTVVRFRDPDVRAAATAADHVRARRRSRPQQSQVGRNPAPGPLPRHEGPPPGQGCCPHSVTELGAVAVALNDAFDARDRTEQLVRTFVSDASHELRTPLSGIHGWADLYLSGGLDDWDGVDAAMRRIRDETTRMSVLVEQMLVRHTPTGTDVWIHAWHEEGEVVLRMRDSGPGLGDTARAHAFDRFWRADMSRSTSGSGLGLAIVGDTVRAHRGSVQLHDAPGGGLDVVVRLPAAANRAGPRAGRRARAPWPVR